MANRTVISLKIFLCLLGFLPSAALAELFDCVEYDRPIQQSYPCDSILMRPRPVPDIRVQAQPLPNPVVAPNTENTAQPENQFKLSDEQLLWLKAMSTN